MNRSELQQQIEATLKQLEKIQALIGESQKELKKIQTQMKCIIDQKKNVPCSIYDNHGLFVDTIDEISKLKQLITETIEDDEDDIDAYPDFSWDPEP